MAEPTNKSSQPPAPSPGSNADRDDEIVQRRTFRDYYIILRERVWIALPLALRISIGYGYQQMQAPRVYSASATMQFEKPDTIVTTVGVVDQSMRSDVDLNTNLQILNSGKLRGRVLESFSPEDRKILQRTALKRLPPGTLPAAVGFARARRCAPACPRGKSRRFRGETRRCRRGSARGDSQSPVDR